jgi:hypothetical protein
VEGTNGKTNGHARTEPTSADGPAPAAAQELADSCVRFVERALGFKLDFTPETLPVLDQYVDQARAAAKQRPETIPLVAQAVGAYLGEVVRRKFMGFWRLEDEHDPRSFRVELEPVFLILRPIELATRALELPESPAAQASKEAAPSDEDEAEQEDDEATLDARTAAAPTLSHDPKDDLGAAILELDEDDRAAVAERLAALPPVTDIEYFAPSTHLEVVELIVEALRAKRMAAGMEADAHLEPDDYS